MCRETGHRPLISKKPVIMLPCKRDLLKQLKTIFLYWQGITWLYVKGAAHSNEPTENYHPHLQFLSAGFPTRNFAVSVYSHCSYLHCFWPLLAAIYSNKSTQNLLYTCSPAPCLGSSKKYVFFFPKELVETKNKAKRRMNIGLIGVQKHNSKCMLMLLCLLDFCLQV